MSYSIKINNDPESTDIITFENIYVGERVLCVKHGESEYLYKIDTLISLQKNKKLSQDPIVNMPYPRTVIRRIIQEIDAHYIINSFYKLEVLNEMDFTLNYEEKLNILLYLQKEAVMAKKLISKLAQVEASPPHDTEILEEILELYNTKCNEILEDLKKLQIDMIDQSLVKITMSVSAKCLSVNIPHDFFWVKIPETLRAGDCKNVSFKSNINTIVDVSSLQTFLVSMGNIRQIDLKQICWEHCLDLSNLDCAEIKVSLNLPSQCIIWPSNVKKIEVFCTVRGKLLALPENCQLISLHDCVPLFFPKNCRKLVLSTYLPNSALTDMVNALNEDDCVIKKIRILRVTVPRSLLSNLNTKRYNILCYSRCTKIDAKQTWKKLIYGLFANN